MVTEWSRDGPEGNRTLIAFATGRAEPYRTLITFATERAEPYRTLITFATERFAVDRSFHSL